MEKIKTQPKKKQKVSKYIKWTGYLAITIVVYFAYILFMPNIFTRTEEKAYLCIPDSSTFNYVVKILEKDAKVSFCILFQYLYHIVKCAAIRDTQIGLFLSPGKYIWHK